MSSANVTFTPFFLVVYLLTSPVVRILLFRPHLCNWAQCAVCKLEKHQQDALGFLQANRSCLCLSAIWHSGLVQWHMLDEVCFTCSWWVLLDHASYVQSCTGQRKRPGSRIQSQAGYYVPLMLHFWWWCICIHVSVVDSYPCWGHYDVLFFVHCRQCPAVGHAHRVSPLCGFFTH